MATLNIVKEGRLYPGSHAFFLHGGKEQGHGHAEDVGSLDFRLPVSQAVHLMVSLPYGLPLLLFLNDRLQIRIKYDITARILIKPAT